MRGSPRRNEYCLTANTAPMVRLPQTPQLDETKDWRSKPRSVDASRRVKLHDDEIRRCGVDIDDLVSRADDSFREQKTCREFGVVPWGPHRHGDGLLRLHSSPRNGNPNLERLLDRQFVKFSGGKIIGDTVDRDGLSHQDAAGACHASRIG